MPAWEAKQLVITETDKTEIRRISENRSIQRLSSAIRKDLDQKTLSKMISTYLVLKANGHPDKDFVTFLTRKETKTTMKLGFKMATAVAPSLLTDGEFRSLVMGTRKQMKKEKQEQERRQREPQKEVEKAPKHRTKIGPVTITESPQVAAPSP